MLESIVWENKAREKILFSINFQGLCVGIEKHNVKSVQFIKQAKRKRKNCSVQEIKNKKDLTT